MGIYEGTMAPPVTAASFSLALLLASPFMYFLVAGARTFRVPELADAGAAWGQASFVSGSATVFWFGLHGRIPAPNGLAGVLIAVSSVLLCEWTRRTVDGRGFYIGLGGQVPDSVCESGPYRYLRHPFYLSYLLAFAAIFVAMPSVITAVVFACNAALFLHMALDDERVLAKSPLSAAFRDYRNRVGVLLVLPRRR